MKWTRQRKSHKPRACGASRADLQKSGWHAPGARLLGVAKPKITLVVAELIRWHSIVNASSEAFVMPRRKERRSSTCRRRLDQAGASELPAALAVATSCTGRSSSAAASASRSTRRCWVPLVLRKRTSHTRRTAPRKSKLHFSVQLPRSTSVRCGDSTHSLRRAGGDHGTDLVHGFRILRT